MTTQAGGTHVRGQKLRDKIVETIRVRAGQAASRGERYVYNASEIARDLGIARSTLLRNESVVTTALAEIQARRRYRDGSASIEALKEGNALLQETVKSKDAEIAQLHRHLAELYGRLIRHSVDVSAVFRGYAVDASQMSGHCILCGSEKVPGDKLTSVITLMPDADR